MIAGESDQRKTSLRRILRRFFAICLFLSTPAVAREPFQAWNQEFQVAVGLLESGQNEQALIKLEEVLEEHTLLAGPGATNEKALGTILVHKAIAEEALGRVSDARWTWDVAINFLPRARKLELSRFGEAGRSLLEYADRTETARDFVTHLTALDSSPGRRLTAPKPVKREAPRYPGRARLPEGALEVGVLIDVDGRALYPRILKKPKYPALSYAALEALRTWRFEPATLDGKPISMPFYLTVNFKLDP